MKLGHPSIIVGACASFNYRMEWRNPSIIGWCEEGGVGKVGAWTSFNYRVEWEK